MIFDAFTKLLCFIAELIIADGLIRIKKCVDLAYIVLDLFYVFFWFITAEEFARKAIYSLEFIVMSLELKVV